MEYARLANPFAANQRRAYPEGAVILDAFILHRIGRTVFEVRYGDHVRTFRTYSSALSAARALARHERTDVYDLWKGRRIKKP